MAGHQKVNSKKDQVLILIAAMFGDTYSPMSQLKEDLEAIKEDIDIRLGAIEDLETTFKEVEEEHEKEN